MQLTSTHSRLAIVQLLIRSLHYLLFIWPNLNSSAEHIPLELDFIKHLLQLQQHLQLDDGCVDEQQQQQQLKEICVECAEQIGEALNALLLNANMSGNLVKKKRLYCSWRFLIRQKLYEKSIGEGVLLT